jgi:diguanylate cyclase (GGDEF)-like protein/PAS domain S-box-containing protein
MSSALNGAEAVDQVRSRPARTRRPGRLLDVLSAAADGGSATLAVAPHGSAGLMVVWANPAAEELVGLTSGDSVENSVVESLRTDELPHWTSTVLRLIDSGAENSDWHTAALDGPDPTASCARVQARALGDGLYVVWLHSLTGVEATAERARQESEHRFRALAEDAPVGIVVSEAGTRLGFVNAAYSRIVGVERNKLLGTRWLKTIHPEDLPFFLETLDSVLDGVAVDATVRMLSVVDSQRWVQIRLCPVTTPRRSAGFIGTVEDITARHAWETQLTYQATHDALTGLVNRRSLMDSLATLLSSRRNRDGDAAVLFCDLDGFKQVNDTLGHDAGDRVLIEVAQRMTTTARDHDTVARIAGDEFVVLLSGIADYADAESAAVRQLDALRPPLALGGELIVLSTSIGIAMARDFDSAHELLQAADRAMYEAKRDGAGQYRRGIRPGD